MTVILSNICFWGVWTGLSIHNQEIKSIPESVIIIYCLVNGLSAGYKLWQKKMEKKNDEPQA